MTISRLHSSDIAAGKVARAGHVNAELDQIVSAVNTNETDLDAVEADMVDAQADIATLESDMTTAQADIVTLQGLPLVPGITNLVSGANTLASTDGGLLVYDHAAVGTLTLGSDPAGDGFAEGEVRLLVVAAAAHHVVVEVPLSQVFTPSHKIGIFPGESAILSVVDKGGTLVWAVQRNRNPYYLDQYSVETVANVTISASGIPRTVYVADSSPRIYLPLITEALYGEQFRIVRWHDDSVTVANVLVSSGSADEINGHGYYEFPDAGFGEAVLITCKGANEWHASPPGA